MIRRSRERVSRSEKEATEKEREREREGRLGKETSTMKFQDIVRAFHTRHPQLANIVDFISWFYRSGRISRERPSRPAASVLGKLFSVT